MELGKFLSRRWLLAPALVVAAGCGRAMASGGADTTSVGAPASAGYATKPTQAGRINPAAVPLGDGYRSTTPKVGNVDSCVTHFGAAGGSQTNWPWINTAGHTWDYLTKIHVSGAIKWPSASYRVVVKGSKRVITFND